MNEFELRAVDQLLELDDSLIADPFIIKVAAELIKNGDDLMEVDNMVEGDLSVISVVLSTRGVITDVDIELGINPDGVIQAIPTLIQIAEKCGCAEFQITDERFFVDITLFKKKPVSKEDAEKLKLLGFKRVACTESNAYFSKKL